MLHLQVFQASASSEGDKEVPQTIMNMVEAFNALNLVIKGLLDEGTKLAEEVSVSCVCACMLCV